MGYKVISVNNEGKHLMEEKWLNRMMRRKKGEAPRMKRSLQMTWRNWVLEATRPLRRSENRQS